MLILSIIFTLHYMSDHLLATVKFTQAVAHNSQCLLHKVCVFPAAYQKSMLLIPATNQNLESRRITNSCNEQNWKALSETMDTCEFKQSCKDYMGSGREWAMRSPCYPVWRGPHLPPPPQTEVRKGPLGTFSSFHPATSVSSASWAHQQGFGVSFPVSPSTSSSHLNVSCYKMLSQDTWSIFSIQCN